MNQVVVFYNPFLPELKISVNGKKISSYSPLMSYKHQRFEKWCNNLFSDLYREINSDYDVVCISNEFICNWLEQLSQKNPHCLSFTGEPLPVGSDIYERLSKLEMLGIEGDPDPVLVPIVNASDDDDMTSAVYEILEEQGIFEDISEEGIVWSECPFANVELVSCDSWEDTPRDYPCAIVFCGSENDYVDVSGNVPVYVLVMGSETKFINRHGSRLYFTVDPDDIGEIITSILEEEVLCPILSESSYNVSKEEISYMTEREKEDLAMICQASPICVANIPSTLDVGRAVDIHPEVYPSGCGIEWQICSSCPEVLSVEDGILSPNAPGVTEVSLYVGDDIYPVICETVRVCKRELISSISLFPSILYLPVGKSEKVEISVTPPNAENIREIVWESSDPSVAEVDSESGMITAKESGRCDITASTAETSCRITLYVQPDLEDVICPCSFLELSVGEQREFRFQAVPKNAYGIDLLRTISSDKNVAEYRGGYVFGKAAGECKIYIKNSSGSISRELRISVKKGRKFW